MRFCCVPTGDTAGFHTKNSPSQISAGAHEAEHIRALWGETRTQFHLTSEYIIVTFYVNYEFPDMRLEVGVVLQSNNETEELVLDFGDKT